MQIDKEGYYPKGDSCEPEELRTHERVEIEMPQESQHSNHEDKDAQPLWKSIADNVSHFLSWILVPLLMPVYGTILIFNTSIMSFTNTSAKVALVLMVAAINVVIPAILFYILKRVGLIHDIGLNERKERSVPYIICILCLCFTGWYVYSKGAPMWMSMFYFGGALSGILEFLINFKWKISVHSAGVAGIVAILARILQSGFPTESCMIWLIIGIILSGLLGSARIWLGRHTLAQVLCGYILGFCSIYFLTMIN